MKTIHWYIFRELLKIFFISSIFLTTILLLEQVLYMAEMISNRGLSFWEGVKLMTFTCPVFMILSIPLSVLIASVTVLNQISGDNEYVAMKTSGWSFLFLMRPVMLFSVLTYLATSFIVFYAIPWGTDSFRKTIFDILQNRAYIDIKPKVFNNDFKDLVLYAGEKEGKTKLKNIFVADKSEDGSSKIILAKEGILIPDKGAYKLKLQFQDGTLHDVSKEGKSYNILNFDRYERYLDLPSTEKIKKKLVVRHRDVSFAELREKIKVMKAEGKTTHREEVRLSKKFSIPFVCLIFGLTGATLGIKSSRSGKSGGIIISVVVVGLYYIGLIFSQNLGSHGIVNPLLSVWIPNIILFIFTFYMVYKTAKESPFIVFQKIADACTTSYVFFRGILRKLLKKNQSNKTVEKTDRPPFSHPA